MKYIVCTVLSIALSATWVFAQDKARLNISDKAELKPQPQGLGGDASQNKPKGATTVYQPLSALKPVPVSSEKAAAQAKILQRYLGLSSFQDPSYPSKQEAFAKENPELYLEMKRELKTIQ